MSLNNEEWCKKQSVGSFTVRNTDGSKEQQVFSNCRLADGNIHRCSLRSVYLQNLHERDRNEDEALAGSPEGNPVQGWSACSSSGPEQLHSPPSATKHVLTRVCSRSCSPPEVSGLFRAERSDWRWAPAGQQRPSDPALGGLW